MAHFAHHLLTALPIPLLPMIRSEFALDYTQSGLSISAFTLSYGIGQLPAGWLGDRIGRRILITIGISGVALAGLLVGFSQTYIMMIAFLALMGIMGGGYHPSCPPMISASVEPKNQGKALGIHMIGGGASFFLAPLIAAAIATTWGWRGPFIGLAVPTLVFGIVFYILIGRQAVTKITDPKINDRHDYVPSTSGRKRHLALFIFLSTFTAAVILSTVSFIPLFLVDHFGIGEGTAAALMAFIYSTGLWAGPLGGYLYDRFGGVSVILAMCFIAGPIIYSLNLTPYGWGIYALLVIIGMTMYVRMPVSEAYIINQTSERNRSTILGIYYFGAMEGGGVLTPILGLLIDRLGFYTSFTIAGATMFAVTLLCSIWLRDRHS
ncbi:MFS transporter [Chloroflexota bacterium]